MPGSIDHDPKQPDPEPSATQPNDGRSRLGIGHMSLAVQVLLAIVIAVCATLSAYFVDRAGAERSAQSRAIAKQDQGIVEVTRYVYQSEAERVLLHAWICQRSTAETLPEMSTDVRTLETFNAAAAAQVAATWANASQSGDQVLQSCPNSMSYDPVQRLADRGRVELPVIESPTSDPGRLWTALGIITAVVPLAVALALLFTSTIRIRRRTTDRGTSPDPGVDLGLVEQPWATSGGPRYRIALTWTWALMTLLPVIGVGFGLAAGNARAEADTTASHIFAAIGANSQLVGFRAHGRELASLTSALGLGRQFAAFDDRYTALRQEQQRQLGALEERHGRRFESVADEMSRAPQASDRLAPPLKAALVADASAWRTLGSEQRTSASRAEDLGARQQQLNVALLTAALVSTILTAARGDRLNALRYIKLAYVTLALTTLLAARAITGW
jgi:hypothetical protein